jgi:hypothetical protein
MKTKEFDVPLYPLKLYVVVGKVDGAKLRKQVKKRYKLDMPKIEKEVDPKNFGCCNRMEHVIVLWFASLHGQYAQGMLSHECLHATIEIGRYVGLKQTASSEEAYTYLIDWMTQAIWDWSRK